MRVNGVVIGVNETILEYPSGAIFVSGKKRQGVIIRLKAEEGTKDVDVEFPREFSRPEMDAMLGEEVNYERTYTSHNEGPAGSLRGWNYRFKVGSGPQEGWEEEADITV